MLRFSILVACDGDMRICDFDVSKNSEITLYMSTRKGTLKYMAPEILLEKPYSRKVGTAYLKS